MFDLRKVLIVDDSSVMREMLKMVLEKRDRIILTAPDKLGALATIASHPDIDLVLTDLVLPDGSGFEILEHLQRIGEDGPVAMMISAQSSEVNRDRALALGALAYLAKPISVGEIARVWAQVRKRNGFVARSPRCRLLAQVYVVEPDDGGSWILSFEIHNLSESGAFLETRGPVPVGTELDLVIVHDELKVRVKAEVTRIQDPSWVYPAGIGITFREMSAGSPERLRAMISRADSA